MTDPVTPKRLKEWLWSLATRGPLQYVTLPVAAFVVIVTVLVAAWGNSSKLWHLITGAFGEKTSYMSKDELEIHNEWVLVVEQASTDVQAFRQSERFLTDYLEADHNEWRTNIVVVRDTRHEGGWLVAMDARSGRSTKEKVEGVRKALLFFVQNHKDHDRVNDTLGKWIKGSYVLDYRLGDFEATYGRVENRPEGDNLTKADD